MRLPLIALIPAALIAGAAYAQSETQIVDPPPAEEVEQPAEMEPETDGQTEEDESEEEQAPPPEVTATEASGTWTRTAESGRQTAAYLTDEGDTIFSASCVPADTDTGDKIVEIRALSTDDTVGAIDIFTSAGNARLDAAPGVTPGTAAGITEPVSRPTSVLASGAGNLEIVSGSTGVIIETDPMLKDVIRECHPAPVNVRAAEKEAEAESAADSDTEADSGAAADLTVEPEVIE